MWDKIANNLNRNCTGLRFSVNQRGARGRFTIIERSYKRKMATEDRKSVKNPVPNELDQAVESIIERSEWGSDINRKLMKARKDRQRKRKKQEKVYQRGQ